MNDVIKTLKEHRSIRNYTSAAVSEEHLKMIIECAIHAPSSVNGQQWSIIIVDDQEKKDEIAVLCGGQEWISKSSVFMVFLMDYYQIAKRMEEQGLPFENAASAEALMVGSVDVGIAFSNAMTAAESLGYGVVPIGAVRREPYEMIRLLELPQYVYPVLGMCIGVPEGEQALKPRLPFAAKVSHNVYDKEKSSLVHAYDKEIRDYLINRTGNPDSKTWSEAVGNIYKKVYFPKVKGSLCQQGFSLEK